MIGDEREAALAVREVGADEKGPVGVDAEDAVRAGFLDCAQGKVADAED